MSRPPHTQAQVWVLLGLCCDGVAWDEPPMS